MIFFRLHSDIRVPEPVEGMGHKSEPWSHSLWAVLIGFTIIAFGVML